MDKPTQQMDTSHLSKPRKKKKNETKYEYVIYEARRTWKKVHTVKIKKNLIKVHLTKTDGTHNYWEKPKKTEKEEEKKTKRLKEIQKHRINETNVIYSVGVCWSLIPAAYIMVHGLVFRSKSFIIQIHSLHLLPGIFWCLLALKFLDFSRQSWRINNGFSAVSIAFLFRKYKLAQSLHTHTAHR